MTGSRVPSQPRTLITTSRSRSPPMAVPGPTRTHVPPDHHPLGRRDRDEHRRCTGQRGRGLVPRDPSGGRASLLRADRVGGLPRDREQPTLSHGGTWRPAVPDARVRRWLAHLSAMTPSGRPPRHASLNRQGQLDASSLTKAALTAPSPGEGPTGTDRSRIQPRWRKSDSICRRSSPSRSPRTSSRSPKSA